MRKIIPYCGIVSIPNERLIDRVQTIGEALLILDKMEI